MISNFYIGNYPSYHFIQDDIDETIENLGELAQNGVFEALDSLWFLAAKGDNMATDKLMELALHGVFGAMNKLEGLARTGHTYAIRLLKICAEQGNSACIYALGSVAAIVNDSTLIKEIVDLLGDLARMGNVFAVNKLIELARTGLHIFIDELKNVAIRTNDLIIIEKVMRFLEELAATYPYVQNMLKTWPENTIIALYHSARLHIGTPLAIFALGVLAQADNIHAIRALEKLMVEDDDFKSMLWEHHQGVCVCIQSCIQSGI